LGVHPARGGRRPQRRRRFRWTLSPDGTISADDAAVIGFDVATFGEDGRIERVLGFLDKVPAA
jgi:hypothetical protein